MSRAGTSSSSVTSDDESSAACSCVTICFGAGFLGAGFAVAADFVFADCFALDFSLALTVPFGLCTAMVVLDFAAGAFSAGESSSLPTNSWLNWAFAGVSLGFALGWAPGTGTCVLFISFMVLVGPCPMRREHRSCRNFFVGEHGWSPAPALAARASVALVSFDLSPWSNSDCASRVKDAGEKKKSRGRLRRPPASQ
jgi:hypothetical protein